MRKQQRGGGQVGKAVYDQKREAGEEKVLKQHIRERQHLKIGQHSIHADGTSRGIDEHAGGAAHGAQADEQRPEDQQSAGDGKSGVHKDNASFRKVRMSSV